MNDAVRFTVGEEPVPPESDIEIKIDFREGDSSPARVFEIASNIIRAFEDLDRVLVTSVDSRITTTMILEDVERSSLKVFLRNILRAADDQALRDLDWKPQVGKYLVKAKYVALEWLDRSIEVNNPPRLGDLTERIQKLAAETDARHLPDYPPINPARIAQPLDALQRVKMQFRAGEALTITLDKAEYHVDLGQQWIPSEQLPPTPIARELSNEMDMVLVIKKPDLLGRAQWQFRHGKASMSAAIVDETWLSEFHQGDHPITPGAALAVRVRLEYRYDEGGDLADQKTTIIKVNGVIKPSSPPASLFDDVEE